MWSVSSLSAITQPLKNVSQRQPLTTDPLPDSGERIGIYYLKTFKDKRQIDLSPRPLVEVKWNLILEKDIPAILELDEITHLTVTRVRNPEVIIGVARKYLRERSEGLS